MPMGIADPDGEDRRVLTRLERGPDRVWSYGEDADQRADVYLPGTASNRTTVVLVHGGFWRPEYDRQHLRPLAAHLADRGHLVVSLDYRRLPGDPDAAIADVRAALTALAGEPWLPARAVQAMGHSAGGHLVLLVAADPPGALQSAVALAPVASLMEADRRGLDGDAVRAFLGSDPSTRPDLDPAQRPAPTIPVAIVHGQRDSTVPIELSTLYLDALDEQPRPTLVALAGTGHFELIDPRSVAMADVDAALDVVAPPRPPGG